MAKHSTKGECYYHLCRKKTFVYKCKHCGNSYCEEHLQPAKPKVNPRFDLRTTKDRIYQEDWHAHGHPCVDYELHLEAEEKRKKQAWFRTLDILLGNRPKRYEPPPVRPVSKPHSLFEKIIYWWNTRPDQRGRLRKTFFVENASVFFIFLVLTFVIYKSANALNELFIIPLIRLGSLALFGASLCLLKSGFDTFVSIIKAIENSKNGHKLIFYVLLLSFVVYAYPNQDKYRLEIKEMASAVDYSRFNPLSPYDFTENPKNLDTGGVSGILRSVTPCPVIIQEINYKTSEDDSKAAIAYLNKIRKQYGKNEISFDKRVFELAVARAKDMRTYNYLDHTNPITGTCPDNMKSAYGINPSEYLAENALGNPEYSEGSCTELISKPMTEAIDSWMESRGHRYNLLYDKHISGAVGCYKNMCAFLGLTHDEFGLGGKGCYAAEEGTKFWSGAEKQPGEIDFGQTGTTQAVAVTQVNTNPSSQQKGTYWKEGVGWVSEGTEYDK